MESFDVIELDKRLNSEHNALNRFKKGVVVEGFTNRSGPKNLSEDSKELIGTLGRLDKQSSVAKVFGISQALVSDYSRGFNGSSKQTFDGELNKKVNNNINDIRKRIGDVALTKLEKVIEAMSEEKINETNLVGLSVVAGNLGKLGSVGSSVESVNTNTFHFYAPRNKNEDDYEIVDVA